MALLETLLKPLLDAQREAGRAEAEAEFEVWKARQRAAGVKFVDDEPTEPPPDEDE